MRVRLIVTGDLEHKALAGSLGRVFVETGEGREIEFLRPRKIDGITSTPLPNVDAPVLPRRIDRLARALVAEAWDGAQGTPADLVVAIDDLELANRSDPQRVVAWVRRGVQHEIDRRCGALGAKAEDRLRDRVRTTCSFHVLAPMVEAYFFADRDALPIVGVSPRHAPRLVRADVEDFETDDPAFVTIARQENTRQHASGHPWWCLERHPKRYLEHLCLRSGHDYGETTQGAAALAQLGWSSLAGGPGALGYLRALMEDLADAFAVGNPLGEGKASAVTYPARNVDRSTTLLRNL